MKKEDDTKFKKFPKIFSNLSLNINILEDLQEISEYAKFYYGLGYKETCHGF